MIHTKFSWKQRFAFAIAIVAIIALVVYLFAHSYQMMRIITWWDPWPYSQSSGYQTVQSYIAVGSGGVFGQGMGTGISKFNYLPKLIRILPLPSLLRNGASSGPSPSCFCFAACCQSASKRPSAAETVSGPSWRWALPFHSAVRDSSTWPWSRALSLSSACPCLLSAMADLAHLEYHFGRVFYCVSVMIISVKPKRAWLTSSRSRSKR